MKNFAHCILTRFNVDFLPDPGFNIISEKYLSARFKLFKKYCYPSLKNQTNQNFKWLVFFSDQTPYEFKKEIEELAKWPNFHPVFIKRYSTEAIFNSCRESIIHKEFLITTRVDNDDCLHKDYVEVIQSQFDFQHMHAINFLNGFSYTQKNNRLYEIKNYKCNPFATLFARTTSGITIFNWPHSTLKEHCEVTNINCKPMWLIVLHETNVFNKRFGRRILAETLPKNFFPVTVNKWETISPDFLVESVSFLSEKISMQIKKTVKNFIGYK